MGERRARIEHCLRIGDNSYEQIARHFQMPLERLMRWDTAMWDREAKKALHCMEVMRFNTRCSNCNQIHIIMSTIVAPASIAIKPRSFILEDHLQLIGEMVIVRDEDWDEIMKVTYEKVPPEHRTLVQTDTVPFLVIEDTPHAID